MASLKIKILAMKGEAILVQKLPITKVGNIIIPEGNGGQRVRLQVIDVGPDVKPEVCQVGDFIIIAPTAQMVKFNVLQDDEIIIMKQEYVLATASYEESLIEVVDRSALQ